MVKMLINYDYIVLKNLFLVYNEQRGVKMKEEFIPVLLGSDDNVYGMARSFYDEYQVISTAFCARQLTPTKYSKIVNVNVVPGFGENEIFVKTLIEFAKKNKGKKLILISCSDSYTYLVSHNKKLLEKYFAGKFIDSILLDMFVTKDKFYSLCEKYNLTYPKTIICSHQDRENIHKKITFPYPIVVKPNNSNSKEYLDAKFEGKKKAFIVKNEEELKTIMKNINTSDYNDNLIIQEFIVGGDDAMRVVNCYSDKNGKVKMMCLGRPILEEYNPATIGNYASIIPVLGENKIYDEIKNFLESIGYTGFSNFDFKYDKKDKKYKVFEINPRQGRSSFFVTASGINLAKLIVEDLVYNKNNAPIIGAKEEVLWINIPNIILQKYITDKDILKKIKKLKKEKKVIHTLFYKKDLSLKRRLKLERLYISQISNYLHFFERK